ncbi:hypothetical protein ITJ86_01710 [Winogradskyella sp. F6397]|uniref:Lipid/polyisoprenoid-binding YceI-like domain-containing protein n=1 Tax=Winogradskyella marina TaxID=2785530 RepID=A0ABS0EDS4_9FLAO|nr:hypothetical protein [Winogradskyella marina]MBF8148592.1 hypothetical protein [Winogradskyella marina]
MKNLKFLFLFTTLIVMTGCSSDDSSSNSDDDALTNLIPNAGNPHTYEFTVTGGQLDGETISGEIANEMVVTELILANYAAYTEFDPGKKVIAFHILNEIISIGGDFYYQNGGVNGFGSVSEDDASNLSIQLDTPNVRFDSQTGTVSISELDFTDSVGENIYYAGLTACKFTFNGSFINFVNGEEVEISGTIKLNFPEDVSEL